MPDERIICPECKTENYAGIARCVSCHVSLIAKNLINTTGRQRAVAQLQIDRLNSEQKAMLSSLKDVSPLLKKASSYSVTGDLTKAEEIYRLALLWLARHYGPKTPRQLETLERLAMVCLEQGHELQAEHTFRHAIALIQDEHPLLYWRVVEAGGQDVLESYTYFLESRNRSEEAGRTRALKRRLSNIYRTEVAILAIALAVLMGTGAWTLYMVLQAHQVLGDPLDLDAP